MLIFCVFFALWAKYSSNLNTVYKSVLLSALRVVDGYKLQKMLNLKMYKHVSEEIQIVRDQILLKESGKPWYRRMCLRQALKMSKTSRDCRGGCQEVGSRVQRGSCIQGIACSWHGLACSWHGLACSWHGRWLSLAGMCSSPREIKNNEASSGLKGNWRTLKAVVREVTSWRRKWTFFVGL